ncbi:Carbohydrate-binding WSC [Fusarium oxysporum f. sp. vasinfectum]|nr:Carbohydrate-binding WSC [Fusarium oxysporum f. sp. vasinfectum]
MGFHLSRLVALAALLRASYAFSVTANTDGNALASAIFGNGISVISASFTGASDSSGTFTDGPFGMGDAAILTSGAAVGALPNGDHYVNNGAAGSATYCGGLSNNAAILTADVMLIPGFGGMRFEVVMASEESGGAADAIGIFVNNQNYALDGNGNRLNAVSPWLSQPLVIVPPNSVTSYAGSSPPYWIDVPSLPGGMQTVVVAICDAGDNMWDSALMIKAEACVDCKEPFRLAYVTTTTTLTAGDTPYTSTITASGTLSGTIEIGVTAEETSTTTEEPTTTIVVDETTTTSEEPPTSTTQNESTTTSQETTSTAEDTIMATTSKETATITTPEETTTTTAKETTFTASGTTTDTTTDVMETSTEASSSVTSEELPNSTMLTADTTSVERSDTVTETSTIGTTSLETTSLSDSPIDSTTTSWEAVQVPSTILAVPTSTNEVTLSLSSDRSSESATTPIPDMTATESLETSAAEETESSTDTISNPAEETSFSDAITSTAQDTPSPATSAVPTSSTVPSNLAVIGTFKFFGCLGSAAGYPSFGLIGEGPDMTTAECVRLGRGRAYIGIYQRSCYAADTLDSAEIVTNGRCDLPCPGDPGLFCGGVILTDSSLDSRLRRRDAPPGILLTLYAQIEATSSSLTTSDAPSTAEIPSLTVSTRITIQPILTSESSGFPTDNPTISNSPSSSTETFVDSVISLEPSVPVTRSQGAKPITPPFPTTVSYNAGNFTRTEAVAPIITTVTYTIVDPNDPSYLTITEYCTTLRPPPCHGCQYQKPPTVEMTTIEVGCNRCGHNGDNTITLNIPAGAVVAAPTREYAAHETHSVQHYEPQPDTQGTRPKNSSPAAKGSHGQAEPSAVPLGGNGYPNAPKPTFHRRPAPAHTPVIVPDAPIVIVSGAVVKAIEGMLMTILLMVGLAFLL